MPQTIGSLQKALDVVEEMARSGDGVGISELSRRLGLAKNQVFRVLKTLELYDYVHQQPDKSYRLGFKFFEIGQRVARQNDLVNVAVPIMDELRDATGESCHLVVRDGLLGVCVARRESPAMIRMSAEVGRRYLLHAGACPKTLLAFQSPEVIEAVINRYGQPAYTERTITDPDLLRAHLREIRDRGYTISDEDIDAHAYAIGVPIYDHEGQVAAAISVAGPVFRLTEEKRPRVLALLVAGADRISAALGAPRLPSEGIPELAEQLAAQERSD